MLILNFIIIVGIAATIYLLLRLSSRLLFDRDTVIEHLHAQIEMLTKSKAELEGSLKSSKEEYDALKRRMAKYPSLFIKRRVYWHADPDASDKTIPYCPECWNDRHILNPLKRESGTTLGVCEKHSPPLRF